MAENNQSEQPQAEPQKRAESAHPGGSRAPEAEPQKRAESAPPGGGASAPAGAEAAQTAPKPAASRGKRSWKTVAFAKVHIQSSFNNTIVTITDDRGAVLCWASAGSTGFKGTKKGTPFAAQMTAAKAAKRAIELGVKQVAVFVRGPGPGRETAIRALHSSGLQVLSLKDVSPLPHNGCRPPKPRRV